MKPKALLKNQQLQNQIDEKGFVTLPFIGDTELEELRSFYSEIHPDGAPGKIDGIHLTTWCEDLEYKLTVANRLAKIYERSCENVFANYRTLNNVFIVKDSGETPFNIHQDWTVMDEQENFAINVWIPLQDITVNNGGLWVVGGSHKINRHVRGSAYLHTDYHSFNDRLKKEAKSVRLKAGEAVLFYMNAIHGSSPNMSESERIVTCFTVVPKEAPLTIYFQKEAADPLEVHSPDDDFLYHYSHLRTESSERPPSNEPVKILKSFVNNPVTSDEISFLFPEKPKSPWWKFKTTKV